MHVRGLSLDRQRSSKLVGSWFGVGRTYGQNLPISLCETWQSNYYRYFCRVAVFRVLLSFAIQYE